MVLTFRSSTPETRTIVEQQGDGRQRVAVATKNPTATKLWNLIVQHPSGESWRGSFTGDTAHVTGALDEMLAKTRQDFLQDAARGDRPKSATPDHNRSVNDGNAQIKPIPGRYS